MSVCIAFAGTVDIATNFFGLVVTVIAKGLLNAADIVLEPLLEITTMSTADVSRFVPGFDSGNNIGNFFIQAINIIAYMIAGVLICCHIISYLINIAHGEKVESIPKLIWNAVFCIVMVICGKTFLTMIDGRRFGRRRDILVLGCRLRHDWTWRNHISIRLELFGNAYRSACPDADYLVEPD